MKQRSTTKPSAAKAARPMRDNYDFSAGTRGKYASRAVGARVIISGLSKTGLLALRKSLRDAIEKNTRALEDIDRLLAETPEHTPRTARARKAG